MFISCWFWVCLPYIRYVVLVRANSIAEYVLTVNRTMNCFVQLEYVNHVDSLCQVSISKLQMFL